jgi:perosamine synthetase
MRQITLGHLDISQKGKQYVNDALNNNRLSKGKYTLVFEKNFAALHASEHGIFMNSGTSALQVALAALKEHYNYQDGDEVIVPAITFIATSNIVIHNNLKPVFVDVDPSTFNIDPTKIEEAITTRTRCIIPVHLFGLPADMTSIMDIANRHNLRVIEDSCETMFASQQGRSVGSFGDFGCFSTYVAHLIVGGVGGIVTTSNKELEGLCRSFMAHGRDSIYTNIDDDDNPESIELSKRIIERRYHFERVGYSYRATELEAAIALSELEYWEKNIKTRRGNATQLTELLRDIPELQLPIVPQGYQHSFMMYPMVFNRPDRDKLLMYLEERGIETRYLFPLLSQPIYQQLFPYEEAKHPVAKHLAKNGFFIGIHQGLTANDVCYVAETLHEYIK